MNLMSMNIGELECQLEDNLTNPSDEDDPYVVKYHVKENEVISFKFFISTKRLIYLSTSCAVFHADATYKLIWQGYPVLQF